MTDDNVSRETISEEIKYTILKELNNVYNCCFNGEEHNQCEGLELAIITITNMKWGAK